MHCGLLGRKLGHSFSPAIHGMLADYDYKLYEVEPEQLENFVKTGLWDGLNVTIPYKKAVIPFCDLLDPISEAIGSVNTLVRLGDGRLMGCNTDSWGFDQMLGRLGLDVAGKKALVLGSGGASATVQEILRLAEAETVVISRTGENNYVNIHRHADAALIVNTTPVGMYPDCGQSPVNLEIFPNLEGVLDLIYNPARTDLCLQAERLGIPYESGLYMLVAQAALACQLWTAKEVDDGKIREIWSKLRFETENIVLIGMPGCGKSTIGRLLAKKLGREFVDTDEILVQRIGKISTFFDKFGEEAFRREETKVLEEFGKQSGLVLATGGGVVTREENYPLLHRNGRLIWLKRDLALLPTDGRPISQKDGIQAIYARRKPLYEAFSDAVVENYGKPEEVVDGILATHYHKPSP